MKQFSKNKEERTKVPQPISMSDINMSSWQRLDKLTYMQENIHI